MRTSESNLDVLFVGGGFRTTSFLASAPWLLTRRVGIVERRSRIGGGDYHEYGTQSTSIGSRFLKDIDMATNFAPLLNNHVVRGIADAAGPVDLRRLAEALDVIGESLTSRLPAGSVMTERSADEITIGGDALRVSLTSGEDLSTRHLVIATGRHELHHPELESWRDRTILSGRLLDPAKQSEILEVLRRFPDKPVVIAGSSHSAMSCLGVLLALHARKPNEFGKRPIIVLQRSKARLFYSTIEEARAWQLPEREVVATGDAICSATGNVFRDTGLRHESKELYLRVWNGEIPHVSIERIGDLADQRSLFDDAALIVQALGYVGRAPRITDSSGRVLRSVEARHRLAADRNGRVLIEGAYRDDVTALRLDPTPLEHQDNAQYGQDLYQNLSYRLRQHLDGPFPIGTSS